MILNKKHLLHQNLYFGKRQARGSSRKFLNMKGVGLIPFGSGMYTFGTSSPSGKGMYLQGSGMTLMGTGLMSTIKNLVKPLLKKGRTIAVQQAKNIISQQADKIRNPALRGLVKKGIESGSELLDSAISGNKGLTNAAKTAAMNLATSPEAMDIGMKAIKKLTGRGRPLQNSVASVTDRSVKADSNRYTQDNRELTLLKDVIRSKPITSTSDRGEGMMRISTKKMKGNGMYTL